MSEEEDGGFGVGEKAKPPTFDRRSLVNHRSQSRSRENRVLLNTTLRYGKGRVSAAWIIDT